MPYSAQRPAQGWSARARPSESGKLAGGDDEATSGASQTTTPAAATDDTYVEASMAEESPAVFFVQPNDPNVRVYFGAREVVVDDQKLASSLWQRAQQS